MNYISHQLNGPFKRMNTDMRQFCNKGHSKPIAYLSQYIQYNPLDVHAGRFDVFSYACTIFPVEEFIHILWGCGTDIGLINVDDHNITVTAQEPHGASNPLPD